MARTSFGTSKQASKQGEKSHSPYARHIALGAYGEKYACAQLVKRGLKARIAYKRYAGDIRVVTPNGTLLRIEVKTASLASDGKFHATLKKHGHTDCKDTDFVILLCVIDPELVIPFVIPTPALGTRRAIAITRNPVSYAGQWAQYRNLWKVLITS